MKKYLRIGLRTMLILVLFTGMACGWIVNSIREYEDEQQAKIVLMKKALTNPESFQPGSLTQKVNASGLVETGLFFLWNGRSMSVAVSYRGPAILKQLCERMNWHLFDRVEEVRFSGQVEMKPGDLATFKNLKRIEAGGEFAHAKNVLVEIIQPGRISHFEKGEYKAIAVLN